ncbi:MAG: hypothetical protein DAHOPDDO_01296 [Ignavibacteriaceae bacterium]|nr:hypothetical protein [Ignavibacteriaceae bacterium]
MTKNFIGIAIVKKIILSLIIYANLISAQNFFPLKVGNAYQLKDDWWWAGPGNTGDSGTDYYSFSVVKDTIILGYTFYSLSYNHGLKPFNDSCLYRYDSLQQKLFIKIPNDTSTKLAVDFTLPAGTAYTSYISGTADNYTSQGISPVVFLGDTHLVYTMVDDVIPRHTYQFSDVIGFKQFKYYFGWNYGGSSSTQNVISAIVDSIIHNPLILKIDSLYPVFDRPVDTFPYLLTIPYTASYSALVDSFCLDVEHMRSDTLVQTKRYVLSKSNPSHFTLFLEGMFSGDKIKLKATITDTSIFYNIAHYPDTGWVVMNVLPPILNVENESFPIHYELLQNYPNPFNPSTKIRYQIPELNFVIIKVYDVLGIEMTTLVNEEKSAGSYETEFDGNGLASGIYYYRITAGNFSQTKKMIFLK